MGKKMMEAAKPFTYGTRRLLAGDVFPVSARDARVLEAIGRARFIVEREMQAVPPPPADMPVPDLDALREQAKSVGLKVDRRLGAEKLKEMIEQAGRVAS